MYSLIIKLMLIVVRFISVFQRNKVDSSLYIADIEICLLRLVYVSSKI